MDVFPDSVGGSRLRVRVVAMGGATGADVRRTSVQVDGEVASYLTAEGDGPAVVLLHGTYWSRVWLPVLGRLAEAGLRPVAVDFPGLGRSGGELTPETATVPALAGWVARFASALGISGPVAVAGHDIGGVVGQHLLVHDLLPVARLALVNSVLYDSWPAPHVGRFRDPRIVAATTADDLLAERRQAATGALAGAATDALIDDYLDPWTDPRVRRSWLAMAAAADSRYTLELVPALRRSTTPKLLVWGEDDRFEKVGYAEKFASEVPRTTLVRIPDADHIPTENAPDQVARALARFFTE
ncbi:pimeloyl-ACP methyl ester carboxylesterase [Pseudonocardia kunmingensis]|uniref:Pimeloyl-ACP methyl ester carboxylesterase n=2 Tax=Pseudonocardia kunmingensis TaxID=630975 RepID=A0A543DLC6_9PSEU|nr:pimeloyl-ACP methyl ester carboxylesterase [Pseudonocardia kunmingensis]